MKRNHTLSCFLIACTMLLTLPCMPAAADLADYYDRDYTEQEWHAEDGSYALIYHDFGNAIIIAGCEDYDVESIVVPAAIGGTPVVAIGDNAFDNLDELTSVVLPETITEIGGSAFFNCPKLTAINIPDSITEIGTGAFGYCSSLKEITLPDSLTVLRMGVFQNCSSLTSVTLPSALQTLEDNAFARCTSLTELQIPDSNPWFSVSDGVLFNKSATELLIYPAGKTDISYTVPESVTSLGKEAFAGSCITEEFILHDGIASLTYGVFSDCTALTSMTIPPRVTAINTYAFSGCTALKEVVLHEHVSVIESYAFSTCSSLTDITLPANLTSLAAYAFIDCTALQEIVIPDGITQLSHGVFQDCTSLASISIPDTVTTFNEWALYNCTSLTELDLPDQLNTLRDFSIMGCTGLTSVTIPASLTYVGSSSFKLCSNLKELHFSDTLQAIGVSAFEGVTISDIYYAGTEEQWSNVNIMTYGNDSLFTAAIHFGSGSAPEILRGDLNGDAAVTIVDVVFLNKAVMGTETLTDTQKTAADCDHDNDTTAADSLLILKSLVDLVTLS